MVDMEIDMMAMILMTTTATYLVGEVDLVGCPVRCSEGLDGVVDTERL